MNGTKQLNVRVPRYTIDKIRSLRATTGMTQTQIVIAAVDSLERDNRGYQGWHNYETWLVNLWLTNEQDTDAELKRICRRYSYSEYQGAEAIREWVEDMNPLADDATMFSDLLRACLQDVDWAEIFQANVPDDEDESE